MSSYTIYPPIVDSYMSAFKAGNTPCRVYFSLSKFNSSSDFTSVHISIVKQSTGKNVVKLVDDASNNRYRATGIIINVKPTKVKDEDNLYYVDITDDDLSSVSGSYAGWIPGWIYKIQLRLSAKDYDGTIGQAAWLNNNASSFSEWSTVCIVKATGRIDYEIPILNIDTRDENYNSDVESQLIYASTLVLSGHFYREVDPSELIHSYQFILYDEDDTILEDSGEIYANQYQDNDSFNYTMKTQLENSETYKISFKFTTINKYTDGFYRWDDEVDDRYTFICSEVILDKPPCRLLTIENDATTTYTATTEIHKHNTSVLHDSPGWTSSEADSTVGTQSAHVMADIIGTSLYKEEDEGRVAIKFYSDSDNPYSGNLCIRRSDSKTNFTVWDDVFIYIAKEEVISDIPIYYDYTIESGVWYKYGVQIIDRDGYRGQLETISNPVIRNFNYSFLLGKDNQQLKLTFDNTMNSFKYQVADSRIDPIGSKYTNIQRNANNYYRVFPINGLISFNMDESLLFCNKMAVYSYEDVVELYTQYNKDNNISQYDYIYERDFREKVLEFLQDGEFKLFKSPTEGNIIVRLMDINCTPNQSLSRMIYSFTSNAYEVDKATMENYLKYGFYEVAEPGTDFSTYSTRLGQLSMDLPTGTNVFQKIYEKYDSGEKNLAGYTKKIGNIHHIKITFDDKPLRVKNSGDEIVVGNNFIINGTLVTVYDPVRMYEFDGRLEYTTSDSLAILGDSEGLVNTVHVTIDFLYEIKSDLYQGKRIQSRQVKEGVGQLFEECQPGENLFNEIYYKYYSDWEYIFQYLTTLTSIEIEADPAAVFGVRDDSESQAQQHVVGATGQLRLYNIEDIKELRYLGIQDSNGNLVNSKTDVLINYCYALTKGTYKQEE